MVNFSSSILLQALDASPMGITLSDPHAEDCPLIYVNKGFCGLTGYSKAYAEGRNCRFLQGPDTNSDVIQSIKTALSNHEPVSVEIKNYHKNGNAFWNHLSISPVYDEHDTLLFFVGAQVDITATYLRHQDNAIH